MAEPLEPGSGSAPGASAPRDVAPPPVPGPLPNAKPPPEDAVWRRPYAPVATASLNGTAIDEITIAPGHAAQFGGHGGDERLPLPIPQGADFVARVVWTTRARVAVQDGAGHQHLVEPGRDVVVELGPVRLRLFLAEQFAIRRMQGMSVQGSLAWFTVVAGATILSMQGGWWQAAENHCPFALSLLPMIPDIGAPLLWVLGPIVALALLGSIFVRQAYREAPTWVGALLALLVPAIYSMSGMTWKTGEEVLMEDFAYCTGQDENGAGSRLTAEYIARLLNEDHDGEDVGYLQHKKGPDDAKKAERVYLPAGNEGPVETMGGAADTSREPIRTPNEDDLPLPPQKKEEKKPLHAEDVGTPLEVEPEEQEAVDGVVEVDVPVEDSEPALDAPAEEEEGWGIQDWYDEQDEAMDDLEIDLMIRAARHRLRIDPDDPSALSILSYYQYLAADYDSAIDTYDRYIERYPEDAAGYNNKALIYKRREDYDREEALYRVALAIEPNDVTALNNLGVNLAHQGRFDEALSVMRQLEMLDPDDAYADLHRSKIYAEMGDEEQAFRFLEKALEGMRKLDTLHHIEFRQDIRIDPSFEKLRQTARFRAILLRYYGDDTPLQE